MPHTPYTNAQPALFLIAKKYVDLETAFEFASNRDFDAIMQIATELQDKYKVLQWKNKVNIFLENCNLSVS